jgi:hypothetical protein
VGDVFKQLFMAWISGIAALVFTGALLAALVGLISWLSLGYVYIGITAFTLVLAALVYISQPREES